jgi:hypothetical protein
MVLLIGISNTYTTDTDSNIIIIRGPIENEVNITPLCHAQGGAYGLNNLAIKSFLNTPLCIPTMDCEVVGEDAYVGYKVYEASRGFVIQCEGFQSQPEKNLNSRLQTAIAIHHITDHFLTTHSNIMNDLKSNELKSRG